MKKILKGCGIFIGVIVVLFGVVALLGGEVNISIGTFNANRPFPELAGPKNIILDCDYGGSPVSVEYTLYESVNDHYKSDPRKKKAYRSDNNEDFVFSYEEDGTIKEISKEISGLGQSMGLENDQILDLAACMVQNIPYDQPKADKILGDPNAAIDEVIPRYPYEVLYDDAGVCTGKTFLGAAILKELEYDLGILTFDSEQHMMLGVGVPSGYGSFNTEYGGLELTNVGFKVGTIAERSSTGSAVGRIDKISDDSSSFEGSGSLVLSNPSKVEDVNDGSTYERIVERQSINEKMDKLWDELTAMQPEVASVSNKVDVAEAKQANAYKTYLASKTDAAYQNYTSAYDSYKVVYNNAAALINKYNQSVSEYNSLVEEYKVF